MNILVKIQSILQKHSWLRFGIRELRWQMKRVPLLREFSIWFDAKYFNVTAGGNERPPSECELTEDPYTRSYTDYIVGNVYGDVLDIGCGHGFLTGKIAEVPKVRSVLGVDKVEVFHGIHPKVKFLSCPLPPPGDFPGSFDVIVSTEFVEHVTQADHELILKKIVKALKPGGMYIGTTPHNPTPYRIFSGNSFHSREYNYKDLNKLLQKYFRQVEIIPLPSHCLAWKVSLPHLFV